jgi:ribonuclease HII
VKELIQLVPPINHHKSPERNYTYTKSLEPLPLWMEMARKTYPNDRRIWMEDDQTSIEETTARIVQDQENMKIQYTQALMKTMRTILPKDLIHLIALFAVPCGSEVRLSWNDDEEQCDDLIDAIAANVVKDKESRDQIIENLNENRRRFQWIL